MKIPQVNIRKTVEPVSRTTNKTVSELKESFKELAKKFAQIPEIGRFKPIKVNVPLKELNVPHSKATISIEPSVFPEDFRTRVLTFSVKSLTEEGLVHTMSPASGNKFSIESTLRNPQIIKVFENFIKSIQG